MTNERTVSEIWSQKEIPVVYREGKGKPLKLRLPYREGNRDWLKADHRKKPAWNPERKYWTVPRAWFEDLINQCLGRFGRIYVIQPFKIQEVCAPACWNAKGYECECSCMGENHGSESGEGWRVISETFAVRSGEKQYGCRLFKATDDSLKF